MRESSTGNNSPIINHQSSIINVGAFTLIELLVVIAIIALLMAILLPVLGRARSQAKALRCRANLKQWGQVLALYAQDNDGHFPASPGHIPAAVWLLRGSLPSEDDPLKPQLHQPVGMKDLGLCPMAVRAGRNGQIIAKSSSESESWRVEVWGGGIFEAWEAVRPPPPFRASCGFNGWLLSPMFGLGRGQFRGQPWNDVFSLRPKAAIPVLLDAKTPCAQPNDRDRPPVDPSSLGTSLMPEFCMDRHQSCVNALFLDWSSRPVGIKELWTFKWNKDYNTAGPWTKSGGAEPEDWPEWMRNFKDY